MLTAVAFSVGVALDPRVTPPTFAQDFYVDGPIEPRVQESGLLA